MFSYLTLEQRVPADHPLREIRALNPNGLIAAAMVTQADGYAEREAALLMLQEKRKGRRRRITVGADKAYDTKDSSKSLNVRRMPWQMLKLS